LDFFPSLEFEFSHSCFPIKHSEEQQRSGRDDLPI
jgi:hypothetical protein